MVNVSQFDKYNYTINMTRNLFFFNCNSKPHYRYQKLYKFMWVKYSKYQLNIPISRFSVTSNFQHFTTILFIELTKILRDVATKSVLNSIQKTYEFKISRVGGTY
jgi:hypothetical protein